MRAGGGGQLSGNKFGGERGSFIGEGGGKHEVAILERLLRLIREALGLIVLGAGVRVQLAVVDPGQ